MRITIFDTSVCSTNLGDFIIMDSINHHLRDLFHSGMFFYSYTHAPISKASYSLVKQSNYCFVGGTNLLSSNMHKYNQWKINLLDLISLKNVILMGVGWWQYQSKPNIYTSLLLNSILHKDVLHSVRDSYTKKMLASIGIHNVIDTSCPTMWELNAEHCEKIPQDKAETVVFTLTDYSKSLEHDRSLVNLLSEEYKKIYYWPQGIGDLEYLTALGCYDHVEIIPPTLAALDDLLKNFTDALDYVGTRLHAGIRALQNSRRAIIVGIDNRATEISKDYGIVICKREDNELIRKLINSSFQTKIKIPESNIEEWKNQFR